MKFAFRWNHRKADDGARTCAAIRGAEGKRLFYRDPRRGRSVLRVTLRYIFGLGSSAVWAFRPLETFRAFRTFLPIRGAEWEGKSGKRIGWDSNPRISGLGPLISTVRSGLPSTTRATYPTPHLTDSG